MTGSNDPVADDQPSPFGVLLSAEDFRQAAELVVGNSNPLQCRLLMPAYHLLAHSVELSFKAYLASVGKPSKELKANEVRHNLVALQQEASTMGLDLLVSFDEFERTVISTLGVLHRTHELRYIKLGFKTLPFWSDAGAVAKKLTDGLHDYCLELAIGPEAARHRIDVAGRFCRD